MLPAVGAIKVGAGKGSTMQPLLQHPDPKARMTAVLPSLVLTLLCLLQVGAEVPVQLDFDTKKVMAKGARLPGMGQGSRAASPGTPWSQL